MPTDAEILEMQRQALAETVRRIELTLSRLTPPVAILSSHLDARQALEDVGADFATIHRALVTEAGKAEREDWPPTRGEFLNTMHALAAAQASALARYEPALDALGAPDETRAAFSRGALAEPTVLAHHVADALPTTLHRPTRRRLREAGERAVDALARPEIPGPRLLAVYHAIKAVIADHRTARRACRTRRPVSPLPDPWEAGIDDLLSGPPSKNAQRVLAHALGRHPQHVERLLAAANRRTARIPTPAR